MQQQELPYDTQTRAHHSCGQNLQSLQEEAGAAGYMIISFFLPTTLLTVHSALATLASCCCLCFSGIDEGP